MAYFALSLPNYAVSNGGKHGHGGGYYHTQMRSYLQ